MIVREVGLVCLYIGILWGFIFLFLGRGGIGRAALSFGRTPWMRCHLGGIGTERGRGRETRI